MTSSRIDALPRALSALDGDALTVLRLSVYGGLSDGQLSSRLNLPEHEIAQQRIRALHQLEAAVGGGPVDAEELHRAFRLVDADAHSGPPRGRPHWIGLTFVLSLAGLIGRGGLRFLERTSGEPEAVASDSRADLVVRPDRPAPPPGAQQAEPASVVAIGRAIPDALKVPVARPWYRHEAALLGLVVAAGIFLRVWHINRLGLNSDEAVYAGQGASIAGVTDLEPFFPTFRAHPLLFQTLLSVGFPIGSPELFGRFASAAYGIGTVLVTWRLARLMYGQTAGLVAALILALMPYHVVVSRQILLDGPMVFWSTVTLYLLARYSLAERFAWLYAAAAAMGLTFLSKEGSVVLLASVYAFFALTPDLKTRWRHLFGAIAVFALIVSAFPIALKVAGATGTGGNFLAWQLFRRPNHTLLFYPTVVPVANGLTVVAAAAFGVWFLRRDGSWRETLLLAWIAVPLAFFQFFPVKGFQYLLPIAPPIAVLAARCLALWELEPSARRRRPAFLRDRWLTAALIVGVAASLAAESWARTQPSKATTFLAGSGGVPGGRAAGKWIERNVPTGAQMMSIGPSMANILQFYGRRKILGLSVSPNPLHRNPVYEAMRNPDRLIRDNDVQYVVWDAFSAARTPFFERRILRYVERYHGTVAHVETVPVRTADGATARKPVITIYEVRP